MIENDQYDDIQLNDDEIDLYSEIYKVSHSSTVASILEF